MDITRIAANRAAYVPASAVKAARQTDAPASAQDTFSVSPEAREALAAGAVTEEAGVDKTVTTLPSFSTNFNQIVENYTDAVKEHYAGEHAENVTYSNPAAHIWDKYKNPESPSFRAELSEDERAWAYDQELDLLNGGKHLQLGNPYVFDTPPTLASAAAEANQACREQMDQGLQDIFARNGIDIPADASFRLTVDESYNIHVTGVEDEELTAAMEEALNSGDNGKNLYNHLKVTSPEGGTLGVDCVNGHLEPASKELDDNALAEVKRQTCPAYSRFSESYDPHKKSLMDDKVLSLNPNTPPLTQEEVDRMNASVRNSAPEILARFRAGEYDNLMGQPLVVNRYAEVDPDGSIALGTYMRAYAQTALDAKKTIEDYYAQAHRENSSYPFLEGLDHIAAKYKWPESDIFRSDLSEAQRSMYYRQERALLTGSRVTLLDPYALASVGGVLNIQDSHTKAMQAVRDKLDALWAEKYGTEG